MPSREEWEDIIFDVIFETLAIGFLLVFILELILFKNIKLEFLLLFIFDLYTISLKHQLDECEAEKNES